MNSVSNCHTTNRRRYFPVLHLWRVASVEMSEITHVLPACLSVCLPAWVLIGSSRDLLGESECRFIMRLISEKVFIVSLLQNISVSKLSEGIQRSQLASKQASNNSHRYLSMLHTLRAFSFCVLAANGRS